MNDRELLEKAAKAAGMALGAWHEPARAFLYRSIEPGSGRWNPLTDDGDALRLAVTLGQKYPCFMIGIFNRAAFPHVSASVVHREGGETYIEQDDQGDMNETVRRAVVRAAAAIGEAMP
jgi:hypothetical protein